MSPLGNGPKKSIGRTFQGLVDISESFNGLGGPDMQGTSLNLLD